MSNITSNDSIFDALFRQAVIDNFNEELDSVPSDEEIDRLFPFSPEHEARMKKLFANERRKGKILTAVRWLRQGAAVAVITFSVIFGLLMAASPPVRAAVVDTVIGWYQEFVRFTSPNSVEESITSKEPAYIPYGFIIQSHDNMDSTDIYNYVNSEGETIVFVSTPANDTISVNNEDVGYEVIEAGDIDYHIFASPAEHGENSITFDANGTRFTITSSIAPEQLLKIAESVPK